MTLAQKICKLRKEHGLTQAKLSSILHVSRTCYSNYETGRRHPSYSVIVLLADFYHVSIDDLMRVENEL